MSNRYHAVRNAGLNTELELLGVAMFGFGPGEKRLRREMKAARHVRMHGLVASEYLVAAQSARPVPVARRRRGPGRGRVVIEPVIPRTGVGFRR